MVSTGRFSRSDRLRDSRDFRRVSREGRRSASRYFVVLRCSSRRTPGRNAKDQSERVRLGITVSRKVGNAVKRNYIKRSVREWFRLRRSSDCTGDIVVIARRDAAQLRGADFASALESMLQGTAR